VNYDEVRELLSGIKMVGTRFEDWAFEWNLEEVEQTEDVRLYGFLIRCSFERPDAVTGEIAKGWGRWWWIDEEATRERVVFTAWLAIKQVVDHELHESFTVNLGGEQVRLLDPHKTLEDLAVGSARVLDARIEEAMRTEE